MSGKLDDPFTRVAHEILEDVAKRKFNGTQLRILLIVWRYTYGFNRKSHSLSVKFLANALDTNERTIKHELTRLIDCKVLKEVESYTGINSRKLSFNKYSDQWLEVSNSSPPKKAKGVSKTPPLEVINTPPLEVSNSSPKIERKKNLKKGEIYMNSPKEKLKFHDTVFLTLEQYEKLCADFGKHKVDNTIEALDEWQSNKKPSQHKKDHNKTLRVWIKRDMERNKSSFKTKAQRNQEEFDILNQFYEEGAARETNGNSELSGHDQDRLPLL